MGHRRRVEKPHGELGELGHVVGLELRPALEPRETLVDVGAEAGLADLTVADDVDPDLALLFDHLRHGRVDSRLERCLVDVLPLLARPDQVDKVVGTRKAPRVGREDPIGHQRLPPGVASAATGSAPHRVQVLNSVMRCGET